jgi:hypothetical protein
MLRVTPTLEGRPGMSVQKYRITIEFEAISRADRCDITTMVSDVVRNAVRLYGPDLIDAKVVSIMLDGQHSNTIAPLPPAEEIRREH